MKIGDMLMVMTSFGTEHHIYSQDQIVIVNKDNIVHLESPFNAGYLKSVEVVEGAELEKAVAENVTMELVEKKTEDSNSSEPVPLLLNAIIPKSKKG